MDDDSANKIGPRKIYRSHTDRVIFGVCGGIAEYYNIESLWVRVVFIFLGVTGAVGFILYLALTILMPSNPIASPAKKVENEIEKNEQQSRPEKKIQTWEELIYRRNLFGYAIVIIGVIVFLSGFFPDWWIGWKIIWPILLIILGLSQISDA